MPPFPELAEPLRGHKVGLRLAAERDIPEILIAHQEDPQLHLALGHSRPPSGAELGRRSEGEPAERQAGIGIRLTMFVPGSDVCCGQLDVHRVDWEHGRAELGIWVTPAARGRGLAGAALGLAGRWLCETCGLARLELLTEPENTPMIAAAASAGFVHEGVLRAYARERDRRLDLAIMSLLASDLGPA